MVRPSKFQTPFDLLVNHNQYNHNAVKKILPHDDLFLLSIIRHPAEHFESTVDYFRLDLDSILSAIQNMLPGIDILKNTTGRKYDSYIPEVRELPAEKIIQTFLENPTGYLKRGRFEHMLLNGQCYDFGIQTKLKMSDYDERILEHKFKEIDLKFDFVMINEYFDESLVLLANKLCIPLEEMVYFPINSRRNASGKLPEELIEKITTWNKYDSLLYNRFLKKFWKEADNYGLELLHKDVVRLRKMIEEKKTECLDAKFGVVTQKNWSKIELKKYNLKKNGASETCKNMAKPEMQFLEKIRQYQQP